MGCVSLHTFEQVDAYSTKNSPLRIFRIRLTGKSSCCVLLVLVDYTIL